MLSMTFRVLSGFTVPRRLILVAAAFAALFAAEKPAAAHPHVWIENRSDLVFDDQGRITAINVEWRFDEMYSQVAVEGLDANGDGIYEATETQALAQENIEALKEYDYFVTATAAGEKIKFGDVTEYGNLFSNGVLTFYFQVPLATPVDPRISETKLAVFDPSYYIAIVLAEKDPIQIIGALPSPCQVAVTKSAAEADNFQYTEDFWNKEANEGMGNLFAQTVQIQCTPQTAKSG